MAMKEIPVKVARVLSNSELALSGGSDLGIEQGDVVLVRKTVQIKDPDNGEVLGTVDQTRMRLSVSEVQDRFCLARVNVPSALTASLSLFGRQSKFISGRDIKDDEYVNISTGDEVIVVVRDDDHAMGENDEDEGSDLGS